MNGQAIITWIIVAAAVGYLAYAVWRVWRGKKTGCGGSCACPKPKASSSPPVVSLGMQRLEQRGE